MIQFNLLPDVKVEFIRTQRIKRLVILGATIAASFALVVFIMLFTAVNVLQKRHLSNLDNDIARDTARLQEIQDIDKILTIQNQLGSLTELHEGKPAAQRVMPFLVQVTPTQANVSNVVIDFQGSTMSITGTANTLVTVNKFVDTLKFTSFSVDGVKSENNAFRDVVMSSFSVSEDEVTFQIDMLFDPEIFNNTADIKLSVPSIISTRSETERPADLFREAPTPQNNGGEQ